MNKEEEADENETEWLMEWSSRGATARKESQENGHVAAKSVRAADALQRPCTETSRTARTRSHASPR